MSVIRLRPHIQGELDGACGFYAIVNALRLLEPELEGKELFNFAMRGFLESGNPMAFSEGTRRGSIKNTLSRTIASVHSEFILKNEDGTPYRFGFNIPYWQSMPSRRAEVISQLENLSPANGVVAVIAFEKWKDKANPQGRYAHWTVISKLLDGDLHTFDSDGEQMKIPLRSVRFDDQREIAHSARPYNLWSDYLFLVHRFG